MGSELLWLCPVVILERPWDLTSAGQWELPARKPAEAGALFFWLTAGAQCYCVSGS